MVEPLERSAVGKPTCAGITEKRVGYCSASRRSYPIAATDAAVSAFCHLDACARLIHTSMSLTVSTTYGMRPVLDLRQV